MLGATNEAGALSRSAGMVLIGSGPSLNRIEVGHLRGWPSLSFNRAFLAWEGWGFTPTFHACLDPATMAIIGAELPAVVRAHPGVRFLLHRDAAAHGVGGEGVTLVDTACGARFADRLDHLTDYGNVGATSLQALALMGVGRVLMVGVDGHYAPITDPADPGNHFRADYALGARHSTPEERQRYTARWPEVAAECRRVGLAVRNASPGTRLDCFALTDLEAGLAWLGGDGRDG